MQTCNFPPFLTPTAKKMKGSTLLLFDQEDIRYEFSELSVEDRIYLRNFLPEIVSYKAILLVYFSTYICS